MLPLLRRAPTTERSGRRRWYPSMAGYALVALCVPAALGAQVCMGKPSLARSPVNMGGALNFVDGATQYGAEVVFGSRAFISGTYAHAEFDRAEPSLKVVGATLAYDVPNDDASMCLGVAGGYGFGFEDAGVDLTSTAIGPVLAVGVDSEMVPGVFLIQYGEFGWYWEKLTAHGPLGDETVSEDYGLLLLGFSILFGDVFAIGPAVTFPQGIEGAPKMFTLSATLALPSPGGG